jgi:3-mercaptopyruvate sulfurtransferase SseA
MGLMIDHVAEQQLVFTCGSGVTACILALAAWQLGYRNLALYDGSWSGEPSWIYPLKYKYIPTDG